MGRLRKLKLYYVMSIGNNIVMRDEIKYFIYMVGLGASLVAYVHASFSPKSHESTIKTMFSRMYKEIHYIKERVDKIHDRIDNI